MQNCLRFKKFLISDVYTEYMNTQLLDAIRTILKEELKPIYQRLDSMDRRFEAIELRLQQQDYKLDTILEGWQIQKIHRGELTDHENRITSIEHRIPALS